MIDRQRISIQVARAVQDTISAMGLKPGDRLPSQAQLARQLSVSVPTLREGLERLELMGLVHAVHGMGTIVAEPSADDLSRALTPFLSRQPQPHQELIELLNILNGSVMRLVARDVNGDLREEVGEVEQAADAESLAQGLTRLFRALCYRYSNQTVLGLINLVHELVLFRASEKGVLWSNAPRIKKLCSNLADALRRGDEELAASLAADYGDLLTWKRRQDYHTVVLGTGSAGGSFDRLGSRLATLFSEQSDIRIEPMPTGGGVENIDLTDLGRAELSITQSDVAHNAYSGGGIFARPRNGIRAICRLTPLNLWAVVRQDSEIQHLADLQQARISAGAVGSDASMVTERILAAAGIGAGEYRTFQLSLLNAVHALRTREIDAFFYLSQSPFVALEELSRSTAVRLLPVPHDLAKTVISRHPSWQTSYVHCGNGTTDDGRQLVPTIGMPTLLVAHKRVSAEMVEVVAEMIERNARALFDESAADGEAVTGHARREALFDDIPIPLHDGVRSYLRRPADAGAQTAAQRSGRKGV